MLIVLSFVFFILGIEGSNVDQTIDGRIIGGHKVFIEDYPYQLSLRYNGKHYCGAAILNQRYAITAAHCVHGFNKRFLSIQAGISSLEENGQVLRIRDVFKHRKFKATGFDYDLAILEAEKDIIFSERALPVSILKETPKLLVGEKATVTGWGFQKANGTRMSNDLQAVEIPIIDQQTCKEKYSSLGPITPRMFCAGFPEGLKDACQGDSGGPLTYEGNLIGVVSWGWGCGEAKFPGVYTNVSALWEFVVKNIVL